MATLTGNTIASTYTGLLSVTGAVGADTVEAVTDGAGTSTSLSLSQQRATITLGSGAADDFIVDGTTFVVEGDNNRVGIGTASPARPLHISSSENQVARFESTDAYAEIELKDNGTGSNPPVIGVLTDDMYFNTSNTERMRIASDGKVGIGTTSPSYRLHVAEDKANDYAAYIINDNADGSGLRLRCDDSDGDEYLFYAENSTTARFAIKSDGKTGIGTASPGGVLQIDAGLGAPSDLGNFEEYHLILRDSGGNTNDAVGMLFTSSADTYGGSAIVHYDTGAGGKGDLAFYTKQSTSAVAPVEVMRLKSDGVISTAGDFQPGADIQMASGRGISFAADGNASTMTSELLDDYEEGTILPTMNGSGGDPTQSYNARGGKYTKIGDRCFFSIRVEMNGSGVSPGSGNITIGGLPFTAQNDVNNYGGVSVGYTFGWLTGQHGAPTAGFIDINSATFFLVVYDNDAGNISGMSYADAADVDDGTTITVSGHYKVA